MKLNFSSHWRSLGPCRSQLFGMRSRCNCDIINYCSWNQWSDLRRLDHITGQLSRVMLTCTNFEHLHALITLTSLYSCHDILSILLDPVNSCSMWDERDIYLVTQLDDVSSSHVLVQRKLYKKNSLIEMYYTKLHHFSQVMSWIMLISLQDTPVFWWGLPIRLQILPGS